MNGTLNKVMLIGYLGEDVKMHYFDAETVLVAFDYKQSLISKNY
jgi:single-strand DNA-binding protein